jgi:hypothetical protein
VTRVSRRWGRQSVRAVLAMHRPRRKDLRDIYAVTGRGRSGFAFGAWMPRITRRRRSASHVLQRQVIEPSQCSGSASPSSGRARRGAACCCNGTTSGYGTLRPRQIGEGRWTGRSGTSGPGRFRAR